MTYSTQTWTDLPATTTPISAARLAHIESGIAAALAIADAAPLSSDPALALAASASAGANNLAARDDHIHPNTGLIQTISNSTLIAGTTKLKTVSSLPLMEFVSAANVPLGTLNSAGNVLKLGKPADVAYDMGINFDGVNHSLELDINMTQGPYDTTSAGILVRADTTGFRIFTRNAADPVFTFNERFRVFNRGNGILCHTYLDLYNEFGDGATNLLFRGLISDQSAQIFRFQDHGLIVGRFSHAVTDPATALDVYPSTTTRPGILVKGVTSQTADRQQWEDASNVVALAVTSSLALELSEQSDPAAPAANKARFYSRDNGSGKTQACVRFPTGAVQVLATEP